MNLGAAVERAIHLVEQLLTLARSEPREAARALSRVPLDQAVADGIADAHALALARQIDLSLEAEPAVVQGDRDALRILVRNLVDNAVRYTPAGGRVRVSVRNHSRRPAAGGPGQRARDSAGRPRARLRPVLSARERAGGRQRPRSRHRQGDRRPPRCADPAR